MSLTRSTEIVVSRGARAYQLLERRELFVGRQIASGPYSTAMRGQQPPSSEALSASGRSPCSGRTSIGSAASPVRREGKERASISRRSALLRPSHDVYDYLWRKAMSDAAPSRQRYPARAFDLALLRRNTGQASDEAGPLFELRRRSAGDRSSKRAAVGVPSTYAWHGHSRRPLCTRSRSATRDFGRKRYPHRSAEEPTAGPAASQNGAVRGSPPARADGDHLLSHRVALSTRRCLAPRLPQRAHLSA
jgi:hypothetical protein